MDCTPTSAMNIVCLISECKRQRVTPSPWKKVHNLEDTGRKEHLQSLTLLFQHRGQHLLLQSLFHSVILCPESHPLSVMNLHGIKHGFFLGVDSV